MVKDNARREGGIVEGRMRIYPVRGGLALSLRETQALDVEEFMPVIQE